MLNLPLCHWSSQLFDLRAPSSTDVPVVLLNQPIKNFAKLPWKGSSSKEREVPFVYALITRISDGGTDIALNSLELGIPCETRKWNVHFHRKSFQRENRTSTFSIFQLFPGIFQWNAQKYVPFRIHPNRNFRNFLVNGKRLTVISRENQWWRFPKRWQFSQAKVLNMGDEDPAKLM